MKCKYETTGWYDGIKRCLGTKEVDPCPGYEKCQHFKPYHMTNADRIRAMTDEELATFIYTATRACNEYECEKCPIGDENCPELDKWLKQPAEV